MLKARLNLWPSSCDVPICSALPSRMIASHVMVFTAPANRSLAVLLPRVVFRGVRGVTFLPEKLGGAQEDSRSQLPAHDVGPLVEKQREIAVAADPFRNVFADDCR